MKLRSDVSMAVPMAALVAGALAVAAPTAAELAEGPDPTPCIGEVDTPEAGYLDDERVDATEFEEIRGIWFLAWDLDDSGTLDEEEFTSCYDRVGLDLGEAATLHESWDVDRDHVLAQDEFFGPGTWPELDADRDGFLDADEFIRR